MAMSAIIPFQLEKVATIPTELSPNTLYAVKADGADVFRLYITNNAGNIEAAENSGVQGDQGAAGDNGWTPTLAVVSDGERRVHEVTGWTGGTGTPPPSNLYLGQTGFVSDIADATDIRGSAGEGGGSSPVQDIIDRVFTREGQWGFFYSVAADENYTDLAKTTKAIQGNRVEVVGDLSGNGADLIRQGTSPALPQYLENKPSIGFYNIAWSLSLTVPASGFIGKLLMAYEAGCIVMDVDVPGGTNWDLWGGDNLALTSNFIGAIAATDLTTSDVEAAIKFFQAQGAGSSPATIYRFLFNGRPQTDFITSFDARFIDFSEATAMNGMIRSASSNLTKVNLNDINTSLVTNLAELARDADGITRFDARGWDTSQVTNISLLFFGSNSLVFADVSTWDVRSVTTAQSCFLSCTNLFNPDLSGWVLPNCTNLISFMHNCSSITRLDISGFNLTSLTSASQMFFNASNLNQLTVGSAFDNSPNTNYSLAFSGTSLNQQSVDDVLASINRAGTSNGTLHLTGANVSPPSAAGDVSVAELQSRGWTVTTQ